jgi:hypothetical protein
VTPLGFSASRPFCVVSCVFVAAEGSGRYVDVACNATDYCVGAIAADAAPPGSAVRKLIDIAAEIGAGTTAKALDEMRANGTKLTGLDYQARARGGSP